MIETRPRSRRGQVATEFMIYTAIFMFVAIAAFVVISQMQNSELPLRQNQVAKETGEGFVNAITLSVKAGRGFRYNYTFPKTILGNPYRMDMRGMAQGKDFIMIDWEGPYGNFSYQYDVPPYEYQVESDGKCLGNRIVVSDICSNFLTFENNGSMLKITQGA